jgi:hypothetical protein
MLLQHLQLSLQLKLMLLYPFKVPRLLY